MCLNKFKVSIISDTVPNICVQCVQRFENTIPNLIYAIIRLYIIRLNRKTRLEFYKEN